MGIEGNLLLLGSGRVHERVRVQISALGVDVSDGDSAAHQDVDGDILHTLGVQGGLELGAHETITIARVGEAEEMNGEHGHVERRGDNDQAEHACHEMLG